MPSKSKSNSPKNSPKSDERPKRSRNAWNHFFSDPNVRSNHEERGKDLMKVLSSQWKDMSDDDKKPWVDAAQKEKADLEKNPQFVKKSSPRKKKTEKSEELTAILKVVADLRTEVERLRKLVEGKEQQDEGDSGEEDSGEEDSGDESGEED